MEDSGRAANASKQLLPDDIRVALLEYRADLLQLRDGLGITHWKSTLPCCICKTLKRNIYKSRLGSPRTAVDYDRCRLAQTIVLDLNQAQWNLIWTFLAFSKKWRGVSIKRPEDATTNTKWKALAFYGLRHGDTLLRGGSIIDPVEAQPTFSPLANVHFYRHNNTLPLQLVSP